MKILMLFFLFITIILTFLYMEHIKFELIYALTNSPKSLNIELISINGSFISDGKFLIIPDPYQKFLSLEVSDNELVDSNKTIGVISIKGISRIKFEQFKSCNFIEGVSIKGIKGICIFF
jgi:hypothetical protein